MGVFVQIAIRNLVQAKRRTFFLSVALSAVTFLLMMLLSLSQGLTDTMMRSATTLASGHVNVSGFFKSKPSDAAPMVTKTADIRALVEKKVPNLDYVIDRTRGWARVVSDTSSLQTGLNGIDIKEEGRFLKTIRLAEQKEYKEGGSEQIKGDVSRLEENNQALIFAGQAERLGVDVGDVLTVTVETFQGARNTGEFTIAAIAKDVGFMSNWSLFTSKQTLRELYRLDTDVTGSVMIYLKDPSKSSEVMGLLRNTLEGAKFELMEHNPNPFWMKFDSVSGEDWVGQRLDLTIWSDEISFLTWLLTAVDTLSFVLISILLVIIAVGIMNSMWMSVRERTAEVGTLRAIGMSRGRVMLMFLLEAMILSACATTFGGLLGAAVALGIDAAQITVPVEAIRTVLMSDTLHLVVLPSQLIAAVIVFTVIAGFAAFWPALRASRMQPVTAIQHIG